MISLKRWGDFLFAYWKFIKKYHDPSKDDYKECHMDASELLKEYTENVFQTLIFAFLEQKSFESINGKAELSQ